MLTMNLITNAAILANEFIRQREIFRPRELSHKLAIAVVLVQNHTLPEIPMMIQITRFQVDFRASDATYLNRV